MRVWKMNTVALAVLLATAGTVQSEEGKSNANQREKHMVDMADRLNTQEFYESKNPDALWSSELKMPWAKSGAINAYEDSEKPSQETAAVAGGSETPAAVSRGESVGSVKGQSVDADQLINIRVLYTLAPEKSRASYSPVSAQNELFRQMGSTCASGFQKIAEWSEPAEQQDDYYLYYQFKCMPKR